MNRFLFVYGTLDPKENWFGKNGISTKIIGEAQIEGIKLSGTEYPAVIPPTVVKKEIINGVLMELIHPNDSFPIIDEYEEYYPGNNTESLYIRGETLAKLKDGAVLECWIYWFNNSGPHPASRLTNHCF